MKRKTCGVLVGFAILVSAAYLLRTPAPGVAELLSRGNLLWYNTPAAVRSGTDIFAGWMTSRREVVVGKFSAQENSAAVVARYHYLDDHGPPAVHVPERGPDAGRVRVFYSLHNSTLFTRIATTPGDIAAWEEPVIVCDAECTYPVLCSTDERLLLFYRRTDRDGSRPCCFRSSRDQGRSFSDETVLVDAAPGEGTSGDWIYSLSAGDGVTPHVDLLFGVAVEGEVRDVYHIRSRDHAQSWQDGKGKDLALPVRFDSLTPVIRTAGDRQTRVWDVRRDPDGSLAAIWIDYDAAEAVVCWASRAADSDVWRWQEVTRQAIVYYPAGACIASVNPPVALVSVNNAEGRHEIVEMRLVGQDWERSPAPRLMIRSGHELVRPMTVKNTDGKEVICVGVRSYSDYQKFDTFLDATFLPEYLSP